MEVSLLTEVADLSSLRIFLSFALSGMLCDEKDFETSAPDSSFFLLETILTSKENLLREKHIRVVQLDLTKSIRKRRFPSDLICIRFTELTLSNQSTFRRENKKRLLVRKCQI